MVAGEAYQVPGRMPRQLADYWTRGRGARKIRWGTRGDFDRCVRLLRRYFPQNPEGLCNRLHTRALGKPPGKHTLEAEAHMDTDTLARALAETEETVERALVPMRTLWSGLIAPYGTPTGDRRRFAPQSLTSRELPIPLLLQTQTDEGHNSSVIVGRVLSLEHRPDGVYATGDFLPPEVCPESARAVELAREGVVGPSVDLDAVEFELRWPDGRPFSQEEWEACVEESSRAQVGACEPERVVTSGRISAVTLVAIPAFPQVTFQITGEEPDEEAVLAALDAELAGEGEAAGLAASGCGCGDALTADADGFAPPAAWFEDPQLNGPTPLTVTEDGRVYGHLATWGTCHVGYPDTCITPPRSASSYAYFHTGSVRTAEGEVLAVGRIVLGTPHADLLAGARAAAQHYDDTGRVAALVRAGEDAHGIWVAGVLAPGVDEETRATLAACPLSGDWRRIGGRMELIAALAVPVPGFPVVRASASGVGLEPEALVATGVLRPALAADAGGPAAPEPGLAAPGIETAGTGTGTDAGADARVDAGEPAAPAADREATLPLGPEQIAAVAAMVREQIQREERAAEALARAEAALSGIREARRSALAARIEGR